MVCWQVFTCPTTAAGREGSNAGEELGIPTSRSSRLCAKAFVSCIALKTLVLRIGKSVSGSEESSKMASELLADRLEVN